MIMPYEEFASRLNVQPRNELFPTEYNLQR